MPDMTICAPGGKCLSLPVDLQEWARALRAPRVEYATAAAQKWSGD
jgi:hypothetical protein